MINGFSWENFRVQDLNDKERAEHAYKEVMGEDNHFLSHKGLMSEYWLREWLVEGRCEELDFSRWEPSRWRADAFMLRECQFKQRGLVLEIGEWRRVMKEDMLFFKDKHYYDRTGGLTEMFETALYRLLERWCKKLKLTGNGKEISDVVTILEDLTPVNAMDSIIFICMKEGGSY
jgi:hypothetical protein